MMSKRIDNSQFDPNEYQYQLELARAQRPLNLSFKDIIFDPRLHRRGLNGRFIDMLNRLNQGDSITLPDGNKIEKSKNRKGETEYLVNKSIAGGNVKKAAERVLDASAQSTHPMSLGGGTVNIDHKDAARNYTHFLWNTQNDIDGTAEGITVEFKAKGNGTNHRLFPVEGDPAFRNDLQDLINRDSRGLPIQVVDKNLPPHVTEELRKAGFKQKADGFVKAADRNVRDNSEFIDYLDAHSDSKESVVEDEVFDFLKNKPNTAFSSIERMTMQLNDYFDNDSARVERVYVKDDALAADVTFNDSAVSNFVIFDYPYYLKNDADAQRAIADMEVEALDTAITDKNPQTILYTADGFDRRNPAEAVRDIAGEADNIFNESLDNWIREHDAESDVAKQIKDEVQDLRSRDLLAVPDDYLAEQASKLLPSTWDQVHNIIDTAAESEIPMQISELDVMDSQRAIATFIYPGDSMHSYSDTHNKIGESLVANGWDDSEENITAVIKNTKTDDFDFDAFAVDIDNTTDNPADRIREANAIRFDTIDKAVKDAADQNILMNEGGTVRTAEQVDKLFREGGLTRDDMISYLTRDGDLGTPGSRYGSSSSEVADYVAGVADPWLEVSDGDAAGTLDELMRLAVNDSPELEDAAYDGELRDNALNNVYAKADLMYGEGHVGQLPPAQTDQWSNAVDALDENNFERPQVWADGYTNKVDVGVQAVPTAKYKKELFKRAGIEPTTTHYSVDLEIDQKGTTKISGRKISNNDIVGEIENELIRKMRQDNE